MTLRPPLGRSNEDLAALRRQVAVLQAAQEVAQQIVETVRDPLLVLTPDFRVQLANPAFYQLFHVSPAETEGQSIYALGNGQWDIPALRTLLGELLPHNTVFNDYEVTHTFERIRRRTLLLNARRLDAVQRILLAMEDITVRTQTARRLQQEIAERQRLGRAAQQAQAALAHVTRVLTLGALMTSIAHEVHQPLAAIRTNAEAGLRWLDRATPNLAAGREALLAIVTNSHRAGDVIARLRATVQKAPPHMEALALPQVIAEVVALTHHEAQQQQVQVRTDVDGDLPRVVGDRIQMQQVLLNLVLNSLDALRPVVDRPRTLLLRAGRLGAEAVRVAVQDTGIGVDPGMLERMFAPLVTTKPTGLGMGLAISRTIIEADGGRLWAEHNADHGITVHFTLSTAGEHAHA